MSVKMSLSKNIRHCRKCISVSAKRYQSGGSSNAIDSHKMHQKALALTHSKVVGLFKEYFLKISNEKLLKDAINKEFAQVLQKLQPSVYGSQLIRYFDVVTATDRNETKKETKGEQDGLISGLKIKLSRSDAAVKETVQKWKLVKPKVSQSSIRSNTVQILNSLLSARSDISWLYRIEELCDHLKKYSEAKHCAVKEGAIRILLRIREQTKDENVHSAIRESFALLGYSGTLPSRGIRILSIDGGGVRGLLVILMLQKLEELTGKRVHEMFDLICGVSTGAILTSLFAVRQKSLDEIYNNYKELSQQIFKQSTLKGTSNLVWCHSYYDTDRWEKILKDILGEETLISTSRNPKTPKLCSVSAVVNQSHLSAYVFRNYALPCRVQSQYIGSCEHRVWEAVRASAAAPTYFEEFKLGSLLHQDGGILVNNPAAVAVHEAKLLWPESPIQCVISFGTGRTVPSPCDATPETVAVSNSSWKNKFLRIIESATDTEGVHTMLSDLLPAHVYYRFNPYLTEMCNLEEINPKKIEQLERDATMYLRRNEDKFQEAAKVLCETKTATQKLVDWVNLKKELLGVTLNSN